VIGVVTSVIGAYYYLRIVKIMYMDEPAEAFLPMPNGLRVILGIFGLFVIFFFAYPSPLVAAAEAAAKSLF
jgi:NADH-quinone oxidoreductase subunit N